jgi:uncharacterized protein YndB with AHSA1/START domain
MPAISPATADTRLIIDRAAHTIRLTRDFQAEQATIFEAWTQPEHVTCWWDPAGKQLSACEIDLRPGGAFRFVSQSHPDQAFCGIYSEIAPPGRLVFEANGAIGRVLLDGAAHGTRMTVEIVCHSAEHLDQYLKMGVADGTSRTLDNLVAYLREEMAPAG